MIKDITQSLIAILVVGAAIYAAIIGSAGAQPLLAAAGIIIGFYFKEVTALGRAIMAKSENK